MEKVMQPKKTVKLTDAEKRVISAYSGYTIENMLKPVNGSITDKKIIK